MNAQKTTFTKYEVARIIGARALQIAMDAPVLLKLSEDELKQMKYDALRISEREFNEGVLPISINRPQPKRRKDKLAAIKEEQVSDEELAEKEQREEKEIVENAEELGFADEEEVESVETTGASEE
jgi:DNA-directed RNA polymerase subunit K/omega